MLKWSKPKGTIAMVNLSVTSVIIVTQMTFASLKLGWNGASDESNCQHIEGLLLQYIVISRIQKLGE